LTRDATLLILSYRITSLFEAGGMTLSVRLDPALEQELDAHCRRARVSKSAVVNRLLRSFLDQKRGDQSFYALGKQLGLFGCMEGAADLSVNRKKYLRARYPGKRAG
jgi:hypothetical protein